MKFGSGDHRFELVPGWPQRPPDLNLGWIGGIGVTSGGRAYVYNRGDYPMAVFDAESGEFIKVWDEPELRVFLPFPWSAVAPPPKTPITIIGARRNCIRFIFRTRFMFGCVNPVRCFDSRDIR